MDRGVIYRATAADEDPTPEALVFEVLSIVQGGTARCREAVSFLAYRMGKNDVNIKYKTLRLCVRLLQKDTQHYLLESEFRRMAKRDLVDTVRSLRAFTASRPHPTRGDEPARKIRQAAQEFLELLYKDANSSDRPLPESRLRMSEDVKAEESRVHPRDSAYDERFSRVNPGPCLQTGRMEGFGNPNFPDPRLQPETTGTIRSMFESISSKLPVSFTNGLGWPSKSTDNSFLTHAQNPNAHVGHYPALNSRSREYAAATFPQSVYETPQSVSPIKSINRDTDFRFAHSRSDRRQQQPVLQSADAGEYEWCVLEKILEPGGAKLAPSVVDIREFCEGVSRLNLESVWVLLFGVIGDGEERWQKRYRGLSVLEGMLSSGISMENGVCLSEACAGLLSDKDLSVLEAVKREAPQCKQLVTSIVSKRRGGQKVKTEKRHVKQTDLLGLEEEEEKETNYGTQESCGDGGVVLSGSVDLLDEFLL